MEAPKRIWANELSLRFTAERDSGIFQAVQHEYIRADLVDKLIGYAEMAMEDNLDDFSRMGLSDLIKEVRG